MVSERETWIRVGFTLHGGGGTECAGERGASQVRPVDVHLRHEGVERSHLTRRILESPRKKD